MGVDPTGGCTGASKMGVRRFKNTRFHVLMAVPMRDRIISVYSQKQDECVLQSGAHDKEQKEETSMGEKGMRIMCLFAILVSVGFGTCWAQQPGSCCSQATQAVPAGVIIQDIGQVRMGMTSDEVSQIMGSPNETKTRRGRVEWEYHTPQGKYEIKFQNDRVVEIERY
jgi:hypothetical protein